MPTLDYETTLKRVKKLTLTQATFTTMAVFADLLDPNNDGVLTEEEYRYMARTNAQRYLSWLDGDFETSARLQLEGETFLEAKLAALDGSADPTRD